MLWFSVIVWLWLDFLAPVALDSTIEVVVLTLWAYPSSIWKIEWGLLLLGVISFTCVAGRELIGLVNWGRTLLANSAWSLLTIFHCVRTIEGVKVQHIIGWIFALKAEEVYVILLRNIFILWMRKLHTTLSNESRVHGLVWRLVSEVRALVINTIMSIKGELSIIVAVPVAIRFNVSDILQNIAVVIIDDDIIDSWLPRILVMNFMATSLWRRMIWRRFNQVEQILSKVYTTATHQETIIKALFFIVSLDVTLLLR